MNIDKYKNDYLLSNIKLDNFYLLWNSKKELFSYKDIISINNNEYKVVLYKELINILLDTLYQQLITLNKILFDNNEKDINKLYENIPNEIKNILNNSSIDNTNIKGIIGLYNNLDNYKIDTTLYNLQQYCDYLKDILEMFFETDKWYSDRNKYLKSNEGKELHELYLKYFEQIESL